MDDSKIRITLLEAGSAAVWRKTDVIKLKKELRIPGMFIGSLPRKPWQNQVMSLPLLLMPEEVSLLLEKGFAYLSSKDVGMSVVDKKYVQDFKTLREESQLNQVQLFVRDRCIKQKCFRTKSDVKSSNKQEKYSKEDKDAQLEEEVATSMGMVPLGNKKNREFSEKMFETRPVTSDDMQYYSKATWVHVPTTVEINSPFNQTVLNDMDKLEWNFPLSLEDKSRYAVFCDLWGKGFFITNGNKFGSDYLLYPGDPSNYHSHYIVKIMLSTDHISPCQLILYGRLASTVKKTFVLAIVSLDNFYVKYQSISWASME